MARRTVLTAASLLGSLLFVASGSAVAQTFSYTGGEQTYAVPAGVTQVHVVVVGAPGASEPTGGGKTEPGGLGAVVSADLPIPSGQTVLYVEVGGTVNPVVMTSTGGFNGGGPIDGGGASDVRLLPRALAGSISSRVIVAGGGGATTGSFPGGNAGSDALEFEGGKAGTLTAGGAGGPAAPGCSDPGSPGSLGQGGAGSSWGGGGGGYYGGGGGGGACGTNYEIPFGSGGGGSSYVSPQAQNASFGLDQTGTPQVTITAITPMTPPTPPPTPALTALRVSPSAFAVSGRRAAGRCQPLTHRNRKHSRCKRSIALNVSYQLSTPALVTFTAEEALAGRLVGGRCVAITRANRQKHSCSRQQALPGTLTQTGTAGANRLLFTGKIGGRTLKPGSYRLTATPVAGGSTGASQTAAFRILK